MATGLNCVVKVATVEVLSRLFRVVLTGGCSLRLMQRPGDEPTIWRLPVKGGPARCVAVRDVVDTVDGLPQHVGFEYAVDVEAAGIDEASEEAKPWAETAATMLATVSRAPVGALFLSVAYEITPGVAEREYRQWFWNPSLPVGKPAANAAGFGELRERIDALGASDRAPSKLLWRVTLSMSWFRQALEETDALFRFHKLWIAAEALNPLLDNRYDIRKDDRSGFQGLRRLADDLGAGTDWVSRTLDLRRELFHGLRVTADDMRQRAQDLVPPLEDLCVAGWKLLLQLDAPFPTASVVPYPLHFRVHAVVHHEDESTWDVDHHPDLEGRVEPKRVPAADPRDLTFTLTSTYTVRNADGLRVLGHEMWGPTGYQALRVESGDDARKG